jgi:hypothetical protein
LILQLDSIITAFIDLCRGNTTRGDAFKLYEWFKTYENNGVSGIMLTAVLFIGVVMAMSALMYVYLLYVHMNGRMLDIHYRKSCACSRHCILFSSLIYVLMYKRVQLTPPQC